MSTCKHQIKPSAVEILSLQSAFVCEKCDEYVEPVKPWRTIRALVSAVCLITVLYAAFSKLQGTLEALALMIGIILAAVLVFFVSNHLILTRAPLVDARREVNPDYLSEYDDTDDDIDELIDEVENPFTIETMDPMRPLETIEPPNPLEPFDK